MKKILALVLAMMMVLTMGVAFADDEPATGGETPAATTYAISVDTSNDTVTPHTYKVYQIFTGTPSTDDEGNAILSDVKYGSSYPGGLTGAVPSATLEAITDARTWAAANKDNLGAAVATLDSENASYDAVPGWYLVLDMGYTHSDDTADAQSAFMVKVVDAVTSFVPKKTVPSVDKTVQDNDDGVEDGDNNGFGDTADHKIGESFQFKLKATIPAGDYTAYQTYKLVFHDTMSTGITFENLASVKDAGTDVSNTLAGIAANDKGPKTWTITIDDVPGVAGQKLAAAKEIEVIYNAHLNDDAVITTASGPTENKNTVKLEYSNNPDSLGEGTPTTTDTTPEDHTWVFTYGNTGTKVDKNNQPVVGAGFKLYVISADDAETIADSTDEPTGTIVPLYKNSDGYFVYDSTKTEAYTDGAAVENNEILTTEGTNGNVFAIKGLDVGTYALYESTVPGGYVQAKNTVFTITATHEEDDQGVGQVDLTGSTVEETIVNLTGSTLPETGGIGTTIFYVAGSILVLAAAILLVTKRRMGSDD